MNLKHTINLVISCITTVFLACHESTAGQEVALFKAGQTKMYKIVCPKSGFVGAPDDAVAAFVAFAKPTREEDFNTRFLKVTVVGEREHEGVKREILCIDKIDENGNLLEHALYYVYVDVSPEGAELSLSFTDDNYGSEMNNGGKSGIPFPFTCGRPPVLGFREGKQDGHVTRGSGVQYLKKDTQEGTNVIQVEATRFTTAALTNSTSLVSIHWFNSSITNIVNNAKTEVVFREQQKWGNLNNWLWEEMERFDKNGNLLMRCVKVQ